LDGYFKGEKINEKNKKVAFENFY